MMSFMSFSETIFLFVLALIIFGPKKLPEIARQVGKYLNEFKRASNEFKAQIEQEIHHLDVENKRTELPISPSPEGTASRSLVSVPVEFGNTEKQPATPLAVLSVARNQSSDAADTSGSNLSEDEPLFATNPTPQSAETVASVPEAEPVTSSSAPEPHA
jgi:Tat protein translocase TatB subunit